MYLQSLVDAVLEVPEPALQLFDGGRDPVVLKHIALHHSTRLGNNLSKKNIELFI